MYNTSSSQWSQIRNNTGVESNPGIGVETASAIPRPRQNPSVAFDEDTRCFYMFGGRLDPSYLSDVWKFNLTSMNWTPLTAVYVEAYGNYPASAAVDTVGVYPGSRFLHSMVLDPTGGTKYLYIYGGLGYGRGVGGSKFASTSSTHP